MMHCQNLGPTALWSKQGARLLFFAAIACVFCIAQRANNGPIVISTDRFQLVIEGKRFFLQSVSAVGKSMPQPRSGLPLL